MQGLIATQWSSPLPPLILLYCLLLPPYLMAWWRRSWRPSVPLLVVGLAAVVFFAYGIFADYHNYLVISRLTISLGQGGDPSLFGYLSFHWTYNLGALVIAPWVALLFSTAISVGFWLLAKRTQQG